MTARAVTPPTSTSVTAATANVRARRVAGRRTPQYGQAMTPEEIGFPHCRHSVRVPCELCGKRALRSGDEHLGHAEATLKTVCPHWGHLIRVTARKNSGDWLSDPEASAASSHPPRTATDIPRADTTTRHQQTIEGGRR